MFDKLKEVKNFKEITDFSYNFYNVKYFKEKEHLESLQKTETYLEPERGSTMELFC